MVLFVNALGGQASFTISLAALTPVSGVSWTYTGLPATNGSGVSFRSSDDSGITFTAFRGFTNNLSSMTVRATLENSTTTTATFDISSGSGATLPAINPLAVLPVTDGLVAQYDAASWNGTTKVWLDKSGNGNNTSPIDVRGVITYDTTNGFLYGGTGDGVKFPALGTTANYTFIHLARYKDGAKKRIFQGVTENWASGFYDGKAGVAYHNGYITAPTDLYGYNWVISSDQRNLYRAQNVDFTLGTAGSPGYPTRIGLNFGAATSEYSDWAVAEVLVYNRLLTVTEMFSVENYLRVKYPSLTIQIDTTTGASFTVPQSNGGLSVGSVVWTYKTPLPTGVSFTGSSQLGASFSIATGTFLNNQNMVVNGTGNGGGGSRSIYLLAGSRALLETPNVTFDTSDAGSFTILQTASGTGGVTWAYTNLPASVTFLSSSDAGLTFAVAQNAVVSTRTLTVTATNGLKTPTFASFTYGSGVKPVLAVGTVNAIDSTNSSTFLVPQSVTNALTGGITWAYYPPIFPAGLSVTATNQGATFTVAQNAVIAQQTITVTATNIGGVATSISFIVGAAVKPVLGFTNQLLNTSAAFKQFTITVQAPSVTYSGGITWSYTLPTGLTFVTSSNGLITFQVARGTVITSQSFSVTATNSIATQTTATFTLGAGTPPVLSDPTNGTGELIINTTSVNQTFAVDQQSSRTGTITWTVTPSTYPAGVSVQSTTDFGITLLLLQGSVLPYQPFVFTATATSGFVVTRTFNVGASTLVELQGPGDPQLIDTTTQQTLQVSQIYDPTYTGPVTWTITPSSYPAGISITTLTDSEAIFTFDANSYLTRQQFVFSARSVGGLTSTIQFDIASAVRPTLTNLADQVLDTSTILKTFAVTQQVNAAYTGPIAWTITPATLPGGATKVTSDSLVTFTVPLQTPTTGVIWPNTAFSVTATSTNTGYSSVPSTFNVFVPRLPVVNAITSRVIEVSTTAYTVTASQTKADAVPVYWTITRGDNTAVPAGVSINSSSGLITVAIGTYFAATIFKPSATNSAGAAGSTTFTLTSPEPPAISTNPTSPQILNVTAGQQQLTFTLTNSALAGNISWTRSPAVPAGVSITTGGLMTIAVNTYFASTIFTITATNTDTLIARSRTITINTPQTPLVNTTTPATRQVVDVTSTSKTFTFTNDIPLAVPVVWDLTTNPQSGGVSIDSGTGIVTVGANQYFLESNFVVRASNNAINVTNSRSFFVNAPAKPIIVAGLASPQIVNTSSAPVTLSFTNSDARAEPVAWAYTPTVTGVTMNANTGVLTIAQGTAFLDVDVTITASNTAISYTTSLSPYTISAPARPVLSSSLVVSTNAVISGTTVYMNNTTVAGTVTVTQTATDTGTLTWNGVSGLPAGVSEAHTDSGITITVGTTAVLRPKPPTNLSLSITATGITFTAGGSLTSTPAVAFDIFTPATPLVAAATVPADNGTYIPLDTYGGAQSVTVSQDGAQSSSLTGPLTFVYSNPSKAQILSVVSGTTWTDTDTSTTITFPQNAIVVDAANPAPYYAILNLVARNLVLMSSATKTYRVYAPAYPVWDPATVPASTTAIDTTSSAKTVTVSQTIPSSIGGKNLYGITYNAISPTAATLSSSYGITASLSGDIYTFSIPQNTTVTPALSITVSATNGVGRTITKTFSIQCGSQPTITAPSTWTPNASGTTYELDTATAKTIVASFSSGLPLETVSGGVLTTGFTLSSNTQTTATFSIAQYADFAGTFTLSIGSSISGTNYITRNFAVGASAKPVLGGASLTGILDTTSARTITVTASSTPDSKITSWSISPGLPSGVSGSGATGQTSPSGRVYTISIPANTGFASASYTVKAFTGVTVNQTSTTFSFGGNVKPVVNGIGSTAKVDTTNAVSYATASLSTNTTGYTWSISPDNVGVSINGGSGLITVAQGSKFGTTTFTVTATQPDVGSGNTTFSFACNVLPVVDNQTYTLNTGTTAQSFYGYNSGSGTGISWSYSALPAFVTFVSQSDAQIRFSVAQGKTVSANITVTATNNGGTDSGTLTVTAAPPPPPPPYVPPYTPPYGGIGR